MFKMSLWLVAAIALGFIFGWLLSKVLYENKYREEVDTLDGILLERNEMLEQTEQKYIDEKKVFDKVSTNFRKSEEELEEKNSLLIDLQSKLEHAELSGLPKMKEENKILHNELEKLKNLELRRVHEGQEFEQVLLKAETQIEESEFKYRKELEELERKVELLTLDNDEKLKTMELYQSTIVDFEEELKLYTASSDDDKFVISKDQFTKIEEQLEKYQEEILTLKSKNSELSSTKSLKMENRSHNTDADLSDGSIVKLFRETYKKITKS